MELEVRLQSTDPARPNEELLRQILEQQNDLARFLEEDEPEVDGATVAPQAGFPTGLEPFVISVVIALAGSTLKKIGEAVGEELGRRIGARIRLWIKRRFPDVVVDEGPGK